MEYKTKIFRQCINKSTKLRTKNQVEIGDNARGAYNTKSQIKIKTSIVKSSLCEYSDVYILVSGSITVEDISAAGTAAYNSSKKVIFQKLYTIY